MADDVLAGPDVVGHEFDLPLPILDYENVGKIHSSTDKLKAKIKIKKYHSFKVMTKLINIVFTSKYSRQEQMQGE